MPARLHIGDQQLTVRFDDDADGDAKPVVLAIGLETLRQQYLRHQPPTAAELEAAIEAVEDALMPAIPRLRGREPLVTDDVESVALLGSMDRPAGTDTALDITDIERQFNRLVDVANGLPAASSGLPMRGDFAANLLILRELMHHAGRPTLTVRLTTHSGAQP